MDGWKEYSFSDLALINPLVSLKKDNSYSFIEMKDLNEKFRYVYPSIKKQLNGGARFRNGDTLFARITPCLENGKICQAIGLDNNEGFGSTEFLVFRGKSGISDSNFIYYLCRTDYVRRFAELHLVGTSGRQRVSKDAFEKLIIDLPPLHYQQRIAEILSAIDDKIELNRQMNLTLEQMAQALYKHYFVDDIDPENLPEGWRITRISDFAKLTKSTINPSIHKTTLFQHYSIPAFDEVKTPKSELGSEILSNKTIVEANTILFSKLNPRFPRIWIVLSIPNNSICSTEFIGLKTTDPYYSLLYTLLCSVEFKAKLVPKATGTSGSHQRIRPADILDYEIPAKLEVVEELNQQVFPMLKMLNSNIQEVSNLTKVRDTLLPKLISGELIPSDLQQIEQAL